MKTLVTGGNGLLAHTLRKLSPARHEDIFAFLNHAEIDLTRPDLITERLAQLQADIGGPSLPARNIRIADCLGMSLLLPEPLTAHFARGNSRHCS